MRKKSKMIPADSKNHVMKTRKQEKYHVQHAQTKRFKESTFIYIKIYQINMKRQKLKVLENAKQITRNNMQNIGKLQEKKKNLKTLRNGRMNFCVYQFVYHCEYW